MKQSKKQKLSPNRINIPLLERTANLNTTERVHSVFSKIIDPFPSVNSFWFCFGLLSILYLIMYQGAYVNLITNAGMDDLLFFNWAVSIKDLHWLGGYNYKTLCKLPGYSIFLAFCIKTGIPYLVAISIANIIAVGFLLRCSLWFFNNSKLLLFLMGISLLFNPYFASQLRIFRNQFAAICFIIFLGVVISMFNRKTKNEKGVTRFILGFISFLGVGFLFYTREESLFYFTVLLFSIVALLFFRKKVINVRRNLFLPLMGMLGVLVMGVLISSLNYKCYGRFITCEKSSAPYTTAIRAFHSVADPDLASFLPKNTASCKKINTISEFVPVFEKVSAALCNPLNNSYKGNSTYLDRENLIFKKMDLECLSTSHFEWVWIVSVAQAGYYKDAKTLAAFYDNLSDGINNAVELGQLKKRDVLIPMGPYFIMKKDLPVIFKFSIKNYFDLIGTPKQIIGRFKNMTSRPSRKGKLNDFEKWGNALLVKSLLPNDQAGIKQARLTFRNYLWNLQVRIFAFTMLPLMLLLVPLVFLAVFLAVLRKKWLYLSIISLLFFSILMHLLILSAIDVVVGYDGSNIARFLPSFSTVIITCFFAINTFILSLREDIDYNVK